MYVSVSLYVCHTPVLHQNRPLTGSDVRLTCSVLFCSSTILDTRFGCITDDHSPVLAVLRCSQGFLQSHPSPCFDIVLPSCSWSSPCSFSRQTPFHDFLLQAVCSLSDNMAKEPLYHCIIVPWENVTLESSPHLHYCTVRYNVNKCTGIECAACRLQNQ